MWVSGQVHNDVDNKKAVIIYKQTGFFLKTKKLMLLINGVCRHVRVHKYLLFCLNVKYLKLILASFNMMLQHCDFRNSPALRQSRGMYFNKPISDI